MHKPPSISICLPAYNEEKTVYAVLADAYSVVQRLTNDFEILVCNDGSRDGTLSELQRVQAEFPSIRILNNETNKGLAYTFKRLYSEARKDFVFLNATDGQWPNSILIDLAELVGSADVIISVRKERHYTLTREIVSALYNLLPMLLFGVQTKDAGGVKLIARRYLYTSELISKSPFADAERIIRAQYDGARISYIPVEVRPRISGRSNAVKARVLWRCAIDVCRLFVGLRVSRSQRNASSSRNQPTQC